MVHSVVVAAAVADADVEVVAFARTPFAWIVVAAVAVSYGPPLYHSP
jgi:hypothetical protein